MPTLIGYLVLLKILIHQITANDDYCQYSLNHVLCLDNSEPGPECRSEARIINTLTNGEKQMILDLHNYYRRKVARGEDGFPPAANMKELVGFNRSYYPALSL